jgi:hypothetical protein
MYKRANMTKWGGLLFGIVGYLVAIWYYSVGFAPLSSGAAELLRYSCLSCVNITALQGDRLRLAFLILGPINAALYAAAGFLIGKLLVAVRQPHDKRPENNMSGINTKP